MTKPFPNLLWPAIRAELMGTTMSSSNVHAAINFVEQRLEAAAARAVGVGKAREIRTANKAASVARHTWKYPLHAPDFVEEVLKHFARSGEVAPSEKFIRRWRDAQISIMQPTSIGNAYCGTSTST